MDTRAFLSHLKGVESTGDGAWKAICPAHNDTDPSLSIRSESDGKLLLHCFGKGCSATSICHAIGISVRELFPDYEHPSQPRQNGDSKSKPKGTPTATFDYVDETGVLIYQACRYEIVSEDGSQTKDFVLRKPNGFGGWSYKIKGLTRIPYRLQELLRSHNSEPVFVVEGEKKADLLRKMGFIATCNAGGASKRTGEGKRADRKWPDSWSKYFVGRDVVLLPDNDDVGKEHVANVTERLGTSPRSIRMLELPGLPPKGDVVDWAAAGGTATELKTLIASLTTGFTPAPRPVSTITVPSVEDDRQIVESLGLVVYGEDDQGRVKVFSLFHRKTEFLRNINQVTLNDLVRVCGIKARQTIYEGDTEIPPGMYTLKRVKNAIAHLAGYRRVTEDSELGIGCWEGRSDGKTRDSVVLVNAGEAAILNGSLGLRKEMNPVFGRTMLDLSSSEPWYDFDQIQAYIDGYSPAWANTVLDELEGIFARWCYGKAQAVAPAMLCGLVLSTWVQTIWRWRPQVFILGKSNSGKSTMFDFLAGNEDEQRLGLFGHLAISTSDTTAAGVSQFLRNTAQVVILDEMEAGKHRQDILSMLRGAGRGTRKLRGGSHGKGTKSGLRHIVWAGSTESGLKSEPDRNRFIIIQTFVPPEIEMGKLLVGFPSESQVMDLGQRTLAIAVKLAFAGREKSEELKARRPPGFHYRVAESYSVPAAMYAVARGMSDLETDELYAQFLETSDPSSVLGDEQRLMGAILESVIESGSGGSRERLTIGQMIYRIAASPNPGDFVDSDELLKYGVYVFERGKQQTTQWVDGERLCVYLIPTAISAQLLRFDREWQDKNLVEILQRIPRSIRPANGKTINRRKVYGVIVPLSGILDEAAESVPADGNETGIVSHEQSQFDFGGLA